MRVVRFTAPGSSSARFGLLIDDMVADAGSAEELGVPEGRGVEAILARGPSGLTDLETRAVTRPRRAREELQLLAPLVRPSKILCLGLNYREHAEEQGKEPPKSPLFFLKPPSAIVGPGDDIVPPDFCRHLDPEVELAFVIGKRAKQVPKAAASRFIAGYLILNDLTDRKIQKDEVQNCRAKGFDTFCPIGPALVTKDEIRDPHDLSITLSVDGDLRQNGRTSSLIHGIGDILEFATAGMTLEPGDIVTTGTPAGVGVYRNPKVFVEDGQTIRCEIEGLGAIENRVRRAKTAS